MEKLVKRCKAVVLREPGVWEEIKQDPETPQTIVKDVLIYLAAIPVVCEFVRMTVIGQSLPFIGTYRWPLFSGLITSVLTYVMSIVSIFIGGKIFSLLAEKFGGSASLMDGVKLFAYAGVPAFLGGVFRLVPGLGFMTLILGLYSLFLFYQAIPIMTGVGEKRPVYFGVAAISAIVVMFIVQLVVATVTPQPPTPSELRLPNGESIDLNELQRSAEEFQKGMENFQKMMPQ